MIITENVRQDLLIIIGEYLGLQIRPQDYDSFEKKILERVRVLHLSSVESYLLFLQGKTFTSEQEWAELAKNLTNIESYFLRDQGQFRLLKDYIIPELIRRKEPQKTLKIWSAGCSTGEEPYSIALVLQHFLPQLEGWKVKILGTDINGDALQKAREGMYSTWSFRTMSPDLLERYFNSTFRGYQIKNEIRSTVQFEFLNLVHDQIPNTRLDIQNIDLIICRNVFIYFQPSAIALVLQKFYDALNPLGYLITGHAELYGQDTGLFRVRVFTESLVYQRPDIPPLPEIHLKTLPFIPSIIPPLPIKSPAPKPHTEKKNNHTPTISQSNLETIEHCLKQKNYSLALQKIEEFLSHSPRDFEALLLKARIYGNLGRYDESIEQCYKSLAISALSVKPYYLMAQIYEEQGKIEMAKQALKRILYLDPQAITAYLELGHLYGLSNDESRQRKMYETALDILNHLQPEALCPEIEGMLFTQEGKRVMDIKQQIQTFLHTNN